MSTKETMTLAEASAKIKSHADFMGSLGGSGELMDSVELSDCADAIDAHIASQPTEQPRGEPFAWAYLPTNRADAQWHIYQQYPKALADTGANIEPLYLGKNPEQPRGEVLGYLYVGKPREDGWQPMDFARVPWDGAMREVLDRQGVEEIPVGRVPTIQPKPEQTAQERKCEGGLPECGPVEFEDSEGVPLCRSCWNSLLAESGFPKSASDPEKSRGGRVVDIGEAIDLVSGRQRPVDFDICGTPIYASAAPPKSEQAVGDGVAFAADDFYAGHPLPELHPDPQTNAEILIGALIDRLDTARKALADAAAMQVVSPVLVEVKNNAAWAMHETNPRRLLPRSAMWEHPAVATPAEVTDEMVERFKVAARALVRERKVYAEDVETMHDVLRLLESLTAQCQVRKDGEVTDDERRIRDAFEAGFDAGIHYQADQFDEDESLHLTPAWERFKAKVKALASPSAGAVVPEGWKLVPVEPNDAMKLAGLKEANPLGELIGWDASKGECTTHEDVTEVYKAMLAAAPEVPK